MECLPVEDWEDCIEENKNFKHRVIVITTKLKEL